MADSKATWKLTKGYIMAFALLASLALVLGLAGVQGMNESGIYVGKAEAGETVKNPFEGDPEAVKKGRGIFDDHCSECHGTGTGGTGPDLTDDVWKYGSSDADVFQTVRDGRPKGMPAMINDMSEEDIWKAITFVRSIKKE